MIGTLDSGGFTISNNTDCFRRTKSLCIVWVTCGVYPRAPTHNHTSWTKLANALQAQKEKKMEQKECCGSDWGVSTGGTELRSPTVGGSVAYVGNCSRTTKLQQRVRSELKLMCMATTGEVRLNKGGQNRFYNGIGWSQSQSVFSPLPCAYLRLHGRDEECRRCSNKYLAICLHTLRIAKRALGSLGVLWSQNCTTYTYWREVFRGFWNLKRTLEITACN